MIERDRPSIFRIITVDYAAALAFFIPLFLLLMSAIDWYQGKPISDYSRNFLIGINALAALILVWRLARIFRLFSANWEEKGTISASSSFRGRRTISFSYTHRGQKYLGSCQVLSSARTRAFKPGSRVVVLLDPDKPKHALIKQLFI